MAYEQALAALTASRRLVERSLERAVVRRKIGMDAADAVRGKIIYTTCSTS